MSPPPRLPPGVPAALLPAALALASLTSGCGGAARAEAMVPEATEAACGPGELPPPRVWRLTHAQLRNTLRALFGYVGPAAHALPADARLEGYANGADRLGVPPALLDYYRKMADEVSTEVVRTSSSLLPCPLAALDSAACRGDFLRGLGLRAYRRPLTAAEEARLDGVYFSAARRGGPALGLKMVVEALLLSPSFLFRSELGDDPRPGAFTNLSPYEIASALSYTLWDAPPDAVLLALAASGELREPATIAAQAARLLADRPRAAGALVTFVEQWLKIDELEALGKDTAKFPAYTRETAHDLLEGSRRLVASVLAQEASDGSLRSLLLGKEAFLNSKTGKLYGVKVKGGELKRTPLDPAQRRGVLTQAAFLAARADADTTRPVDRGSFVREEILCAEVPPPPDEFKFDASKITEDMTAREKLTAHARSAFCARCHALFDGIGFALERYDAVGQYRTHDRGKLIDASGTLPLPGQPSIAFVDFVDLIDKLARRPEPYDCFAERTLAYTTGRRAEQLPTCEKRALARTFRGNGYRIEALVQAIVESPGFVQRRNPLAPAVAEVSGE